MKFIQDIKTFFGKRRLNLQAMNIHKKNKLVSFDQMHEIGIVYDAANKQNEENVQRFAASLRELGKKVFLMGFVDEKILPHTKKIHIQSEFFWQEKLDVFNLPDKSKIGRFLNTHFDLLISVYFDDILPLHAMSVYTKADYKISAMHENGTRYFDAMIDTKNNKDIVNLTQQIYHYLNVIK